MLREWVEEDASRQNQKRVKSRKRMLPSTREESGEGREAVGAKNCQLIREIWLRKGPAKGLET